MIRAKFLCIEKAESGYKPDQTQTKVLMQPVTSDSEENDKFFRYTPAGKIELMTLNAKAAGQFEAGKEYYVDFTSTDADSELKEFLSEPFKPLIDEEDLLLVLKKNNEQLYEAIKLQDEARESDCEESIKNAERVVATESGEALMLVKMLRYLRGEISFEELI